MFYHPVVKHVISNIHDGKEQEGYGEKENNSN